MSRPAEKISDVIRPFLAELSLWTMNGMKNGMHMPRQDAVAATPNAKDIRITETSIKITMNYTYLKVDNIHAYMSLKSHNLGNIP